MTAPNLTPAEALAYFRVYHVGGTTQEWGDVAGRDPEKCIAALETLLSEHEAVKAKLATLEAMRSIDEMANDKELCAKVVPFVEPAAAVPSDEEIVQALLDIGGDCPIEVYHTIKLTIRRIGVKL